MSIIFKETRISKINNPDLLKNLALWQSKRYSLMPLGCELIDADTSFNRMGRREYIKTSNRSTTIQKKG